MLVKPDGHTNILQSNTPTVLIILKKKEAIVNLPLLRIVIARLPLENYKNITRIIIRVASLQN